MSDELHHLHCAGCGGLFDGKPSGDPDTDFCSDKCEGIEPECKPEVRTADLTPEALKTEEGAKRCQLAMDNVDIAVRNVARVMRDNENFLFSLMNHVKYHKPSVLEDMGIPLSDIDEIQEEIREVLKDWSDATEEFLRSLVGRPPAEKD
jgi:hypothetical protein